MTHHITPTLIHGKPSAVASGVLILRRTDSGWIGFRTAGEAINHSTSTGPVSTMETRHVR